MVVTSIFSFSHNVFKKPFSRDHLNSALYFTNSSQIFIEFQLVLLSPTVLHSVACSPTEFPKLLVPRSQDNVSDLVSYTILLLLMVFIIPLAHNTIFGRTKDI